MDKKELILLETADNAIVLPVQSEENTVWLSRAQMAELFSRDVKTIGKHINNALREELDGQVVVANLRLPLTMELLKARRKHIW